MSLIQDAEDHIFDRMKAFVENDSYVSYSDVSASEFGRDMFYFHRKFNPLDEPEAYIDVHESHEMKMMPLIGTGLHHEWEMFNKKFYPHEQSEEKFKETFEGIVVGGTVDNVMEIDREKYVFDLKTKQALGYNSYYGKRHDPLDLESAEKFNMMVWQLSLNRWLQRDKQILSDIGFIGILGYSLWKDKKTGDYPVPINVIPIQLKSFDEVEQRLRDIANTKNEQPAMHCNPKQCKYCDLVCYSNKRLKYGEVQL